jgi:hypothetical protein
MRRRLFGRGGKSEEAGVRGDPDTKRRREALVAAELTDDQTRNSRGGPM